MRDHLVPYDSYKTLIPFTESIFPLFNIVYLLFFLVFWLGGTIKAGEDDDEYINN